MASRKGQIKDTFSNKESFNQNASEMGDQLITRLAQNKKVRGKGRGKIRAALEGKVATEELQALGGDTMPIREDDTKHPFDEKNPAKEEDKEAYAYPAWKRDQDTMGGIYPPRPGKYGQVDLDNKVLELFQAGKLIYEIAQELNISVEQVIEISKKAWENFGDSPEHFSKDAQVEKDFPDTPLAKGDQNFTFTKGRREGNRWIIEVTWPSDQMDGLSEGNIEAQIRTAVQSQEEKMKYGSTSNIEVDKIDLESGKATVSFKSDSVEEATPSFESIK
jgi:hypothetical protein